MTNDLSRRFASIALTAVFSSLCLFGALAPSTVPQQATTAQTVQIA